MGQTLSEPVTEKKSSKGGDARLLYGLSAMQGWRISMEDAHTALLDLTAGKDNDDEKADGSKDRRILSFFGVYDGHGGDKVAHFAGENIHKIVAKQEAFRQGNLEQALKDGFLATDRAILSDPRYEEEVSGCTASVGIVTDDRIYVANAGDSRTVLGVKGRAKPLSFDHKPQNEGEKARINGAGGFVDFGRVNGNLALSRAIGDFEFKKSADLAPEQQIVTAYPDVVVHEITDDDEFLVIACDGIWDCQSSQAVIEFVRRGIVAKQDLQQICENMMDNCLAANSDTGGVGCDNMTMIVIGLLRGRSKDEWYEEVARRAANGDGPCAPPEYGKSSERARQRLAASPSRSPLTGLGAAAEFRGPGAHHSFEESADEFDAELDHRFSHHSSGRIILLGDGTEVLTDSNDAETFDHDAEDKDLESQVVRGQHGPDGSASPNDKSSRMANSQTNSQTNARETTSSPGARQADGKPADDRQVTPDGALERSTAVPEKLFTPPKLDGENEKKQLFDDKPPEQSPRPIGESK